MNDIYTVHMYVCVSIHIYIYNTDHDKADEDLTTEAGIHKHFSIAVYKFVSSQTSSYLIALSLCGA